MGVGTHVLVVAEDPSRAHVPSITRHVVRQHQNDVRVGDAVGLYGVVDAERVGDVPVIKPEA